MQGYIIALLEDPIQITHHFHSVREISRRLIGIVGKDIHLHGQGTYRQSASDVSAADDSQCLTVQCIFPDFQFSLVIVVDPGLVKQGHVSAALQDQQHSSLGNRRAVGNGCIQGLNTIIVAGLYVQRVESGPMADNHLQIGIGFDDFSGDRRNPDNHGIRLILFHVCQNIFRFKSSSFNNRVSCVLQELSSFTHNLLGK